MDAGLSHSSSNDTGVDSPWTNNPQEKKLVEVKWLDILATAGWEKAEDVDVPEFISVGWLVSRDAKQIKIASTLDYNDAFGDAKSTPKPVPYGITAFPTGAVIKLTFL